ncbi:hypothetical protein L6468_02360 [Prevotella communis]|uniref:hypothetical protein n=1 Tax=Prevotella communis TaxID=2913614 RepID=UPI001EDC6B75|nr:hypothetical protein [Prevotella communis]UKK62630.1 hypothetical protein L6468_02360 [Prevotella communis]UKK65455.1 hypothetical protein L6473_02355 [Prevotella communis]
MRTEFVYSVIALGAIPVMANAADVNVKATQINAQVLQSANGKLDLGKFALAPGMYALKGIVTTNVYDVKIKVDGEEKCRISAGPSAVELGDNDENNVVIDLTKKTGITEVAISLESTDPEESGADFTFGAPFINLTFDFAGAVEALKGQSSTLAAKINGYAYSDAFESLGKKYAAKKEDADSLERINLKIGNIKTNAEASYDDYVNFKLYAEKSTIQKEIEDLDAKTAAAEAAYLNEQAYARVNAVITTIKGKYNAAVTELEQALIKEAAYLLGNAEKENTAKYDLNENINKKITEATQASYASYTGKTAAADEVTNKGKIPTEEQISDIVAKWKGKAVDNQKAYDDLHAIVTGFQTRLDNVKPKSNDISTAWPKTEAENAINALNTKIENARNSAAQVGLDITTEQKAAETKLSTLESKVATANAEFDANKATTEAIATLQTNLNNAKTAVNALKSTDGLYEAKNYYEAYVNDIQNKISKLTSDAAKAYKADGTGTARTFNEALKTKDIQDLIDTYAGTTEPAVDGMPKQAVAKYNALQTAMAKYKTDLDAARDQVKDLAIYTAEGYDYKTKLDLIQKRINDIKKAIKTAQEKVGAEHWAAMLDINADEAITTDIATLLTNVQADQNSFDATALADSLTALNDKIGAFSAKDASKLGADVAAFQGVEGEIQANYAAVANAKNAINPSSETTDYTAKVSTAASAWGGVACPGDNSFAETYGTANAVAQTGVIMQQKVNVENGIYTVELCANANFTPGRGFESDLVDGATDVAYVFANGKQTPVVAHVNGGLDGSYTIENVIVSDGVLTMGLGKAKAGTNWHTLKIKSLKANTASVLQGLAKKVADLNKQQTALETFAKNVEDRVAANGKAKADLATSIGNKEATPKTGLWKKIDDFKTTYKIGTDESTLGNTGKASGAVATEVGDLEKALTALQGSNDGFDPTAVTNVDKTDKVSKEAAAWGGSVPPFGDQTIVEKYESTTENTGNIMSQKVTGLDNGIYDVTLRANANFTPNRGFDGLSGDATDVAYIYANDIKLFITAKKDGGTDGEYTISNVLVTDGTLNLGMAKAKPGTNWHTIQIKSLKYHENDQTLVYNNTDEKAPGLNVKYTKLSAQLTALEEAAPAIKAKVEANGNLKTSALKAVTDLQAAELAALKSLKNVTNETAVSDDATAKKGDFKVFETGLAADKSYTAKKAAIDADIEAMSTAIADSAAAETLGSAWKDNSISVTKKVNNKDVTTVYSIATITQAINNLKAEAKAESDNWEAYKALVDNNMAKLQPDTIFTKTDGNNLVALSEAEIAAVCGEAAKDYYLGLQQDYATKKATILTNMKKDLTDRKSVSTKDAFVTEITNLIAKVKAVKSDAIANKKKYDEQKKAADATQTLWNNTYTEIAATDLSSKVQDWLNELDSIQVTLTGYKEAVEANYKEGKSVAGTKDFAAIQASIEDVKARQNASYSEFVTADNKAAHESFMGYEKDGKHVDGTIDLATKAYQTAVEERAKYSSTNAAIKDAVDAAAADLDAALYSCPTDIATLTQKENAAYVATVSPEVFSVDDYNTQATTIQQNITTALNTFKDAVKTAIKDNVWTPKKDTFNDKLSAAKNAIKAYDADAQKDAFKDVEDLIAAGEKALNEWSLADVEAAIDGLADIDNMLADDKDAAAAKDIDKRIKAADDKYAEIKADIEKKTIADDVNNVKATQLDNLEKAYDDKDDKTKTDVAYAKSLKKNFANRDEAAGILDEFLTIADNAQKAVDNAIAADKDNAKAYEEILAAIKPLEDKLTEAKAAIAPYKYATSSATLEGLVKQGKDAAKQYKEAGTAVAKKATLLGYIESHANDVEEYLTTAFGTEKTGLSADITELKNQYNAYVAANGLGETATAYKKDIDDLEAAVAAIAIEDLDKPADDIQYDEILAATAKLVKLQNDIADKETELLAANASTANADVLADFNTQIGTLETTASLEGNDAWVGDQKVGDKKISDAIAEIQAQIADVKAAIQGEDNISFYKDQYQAKLDAIKTALTPVANAIKGYQDQFTTNATAYEKLSKEIDDLQKAINDAKAKVGTYEYVGDAYLYSIEEYNDAEEPELTGGAQKYLNDAAKAIEDANKTKSLTENSAVANKANIESLIQNYLNNSAYSELDAQRQALSDDLTNVINVKYKANTYSNALWARVIAEKVNIVKHITALWKEYYTSMQTYVGSFDVEAQYFLNVSGLGYYYVKYEDGKFFYKDCTSDADFAEQMKTVAAIAKEITDLADAIDNLSLLGDANEDKAVNVLDYQKVLNMILDPTAQPAGDSDLFQNVDINQNEVIEVGDLTAIVNYILTHDWNGYAAARAEKMEGESLTMTQGTNRIAVNLANVTDYTAFQMDLVLPEGMKLVGAQLSDRAGESHKLYSRTQLDGSIRMVASSVKGETFSGNEGAVLYLEVEGTGTPELLNILFSDANAVTRSFAIGNDATGIDTVSTFESLKQKVYDLGGRVKNGLKKGINIIRRADGTTGKVVK